MLRTLAAWRWLVPSLVMTAIVLVWIPPRAPYIHGSGFSADKIVKLENSSRWCNRPAPPMVKVGDSTYAFIEAVNDDECVRRIAHRRGVAVFLLVGAVLLMHRRQKAHETLLDEQPHMADTPVG